MGFEVLFKYHERLDEGGYDKEEEKEMSKRVGKAYEDVPLSKLATSVMGQLARRDIWVTDVQVFEYKKTNVNFRETKGGIVLKNKKFSYDNMDGNLVEEEDPQQPLPHNQHNQLVQVPQNGQQLTHLDKSRPVKIVMVDDGNDHIMHKMKQNNLAFTPGKKYPVFRVEDGATFGTYKYSMVDDRGRDVVVLDEYFVNPNVSYQRDTRQDGFESREENEVKLSYGNQADFEMPDIRR